MICNIGTFVAVYVALVCVLSFSDVVDGTKAKASKEKLPKVYDIKLYSMKQFDGRMVQIKVEMDECVNLPSSWEKQVSSVDTPGCIILYADQDCRGFRKRLDKWSFGSSNLKDISFESKLSSISTCPSLKKNAVSEEL